jgi:hypothetical protein
MRIFDCIFSIFILKFYTLFLCKNLGLYTFGFTFFDANTCISELCFGGEGFVEVVVFVVDFHDFNFIFFDIGHEGENCVVRGFSFQARD